MNTASPPPDDARRARWQQLWHSLHAVRFDPLPSAEEVEQVFATLPKRQPQENPADWLARIGQSAGGGSLRFRPLVEFERWAASSKLEEFPLPEAPMIAPNESFRLSVAKIGQGLRLQVEALGFAVADYAGRTLGVAARADGGGQIAEIRLDSSGKGEVYLEDSAAARQALARPWLGLIESGDGE